jgi:hypothetical protein
MIVAILIGTKLNISLRDFFILMGGLIRDCEYQDSAPQLIHRQGNIAVIFHYLSTFNQL